MKKAIKVVLYTIVTVFAGLGAINAVNAGIAGYHETSVRKGVQRLLTADI
jgi:hypothetical protein